MTVSIKDVAKRAGVSTTTVSRALSGQGYISEDRRKLVLEAAAELHYKPKEYKKRQAVSSVSNIIGVVLPDIRNAYFMGIVRGIQDYVRERGYDVFVCDTQENSALEIRSLAALHSCRVRGLIVAVASEVAEYNTEYLKSLNDEGTPVVLIDRDVRIPGIDSVVMDNYRGARNAVDVLVENGHRDIAILSGPTVAKTGVDRLNGYLASLKAHGIPVREEYIGYGDFRAHSGYEITKRLMTMHPHITAIFSANQRMTVGCIEALNEMGLQVPGDVSVLSFGMSDTLSALDSSLSHVYQPSPPMGEESARILLAKIEMGKKYRKLPSKQTMFSTECILNGSEKFPVNRKQEHEG